MIYYIPSMALFLDEKVSKDALEFIEIFLDNGLKCNALDLYHCETFSVFTWGLDSEELELAESR